MKKSIVNGKNKNLAKRGEGRSRKPTQRNTQKAPGGGLGH